MKLIYSCDDKAFLEMADDMESLLLEKTGSSIASEGRNIITFAPKTLQLKGVSLKSIS